VTTGGTLEELEELVHDNEAEVAGVFSMINRSDHENWNGRPFRSLLSVNYPVYSADECPLCDDGEDAYRPGTKDAEEETAIGRSQE
jgi:orotate phosphoribosyltransferase